MAGGLDPTALAPDLPEPSPPRPAAPGPVSGRYRSGVAPGSGLQIELRLDIDGERPLGMASGDVLQGPDRVWLASFRLAAPLVTRADGLVRLSGHADWSRPVANRRIDILVPEGCAATGGTALLAFVDPDGAVQARWGCTFRDSAFRTIRVESDRVAGDHLAPDYHDLAEGRRWTVAAAYAAAGLELLPGREEAVISIAGAGADDVWDDAELASAMATQRRLESRDADWTVYVLSAGRHRDPRTRGLMFDMAQRRGCAVFNTAISVEDGGNPLWPVRLRTHVHEIGHCLNLVHPADKGSGRRRGQSRTASASWMNMPHEYRAGGARGVSAYWQAFRYAFDADELAHLRHGFLGDVRPGASAYGGAHAADEAVPGAAGLTLELKLPDQQLLGAPIIAGLRLRAGSGRAPGLLHPRFGRCRIAITGPDGVTRAFRPFGSHCGEEGEAGEEGLLSTRGVIREAAYIGYGLDGLMFAAPGTYRVAARYHAPDGRLAVAPPVAITILPPASEPDRIVARLFLGEQQGQLMALLGSDCPTLATGRDALREAIAEFPSHALTDYARLVEGMNLARTAKAVLWGGAPRVLVRPGDPRGARSLLQLLLPASDRRPQLDPVTLALVAERVGGAMAALGDPDAGLLLARPFAVWLNRQGLPPAVCRAVARRLAGLEPGEIG